MICLVTFSAALRVVFQSFAGAEENPFGGVKGSKAAAE